METIVGKVQLQVCFWNCKNELLISEYYVAPQFVMHQWVKPIFH